MPSDATDGRPVLLFDGECNLCNGSVRFVMKRDRGERFLFAQLQSEAGRRLVREHGLDPDEMDTMILVDESGRVHVRSGAVLRTARRLRFPWPCAAVFLIVPPFLRDAVYRFVAKRRYRVFGKLDACPLPTPDQAARFL